MRREWSASVLPLVLLSMLTGCGGSAALPSSGANVARCADGQLRSTESLNGGGGAGYIAVNLVDVGRRACLLEGFPHVVAYARGRRVAVSLRRVAGVITASTAIRPVLLSPISATGTAREVAFFEIELQNNCTRFGLRVLAGVGTRGRGLSVTTGSGARCDVPGQPLFVTVSQFQSPPS